jgi:hypothetical protein
MSDTVPCAVPTWKFRDFDALTVQVRRAGGVYVMFTGTRCLRPSLFELPAVGHKLARFGIVRWRLADGPVLPLTRCVHVFH